MHRLPSILLVFAVATGCAASNQAAIYTEDGLRAGAKVWDTAYRAKAQDCESRFEPATPAMEECFGAFYDADAKVGKAIESAVALLRVYWVARAAGEKPDIKKLATELATIIDDLPPEAREYFKRVQGLK